MIKYELHIGETFDLEKGEKCAKQIIQITEEQFAVIQQFAYTKKDADLNTIYKLNDCEFKVYPYFNLNPQPNNL